MADEGLDPSARARVHMMDDLIASARSRLDKRTSAIRRHVRERTDGPQGEALSEIITKRIELVPLESIREDPRFENLRLIANAETLDQLAESMRLEGLKVPVELIASSPEPDHHFYVRAGFRRVRAARKLGWQKIPAIILPHDTPLVDEYWTNIIENAVRDKLTTYEIAHAAATMRQKFRVPPREFARRAGYSETYVGNLLRCYDNLPPQIIEVWREAAPIPLDLYIKWSGLRPDEAVHEMLTYCGRHPQVVQKWRPPAEIRQKAHPARMASATGLARMQRLRFAVEVCRELDERSRSLCLQVIDYCTGSRQDVPRVHDEEKPARRPYRSRRRQDD